MITYREWTEADLPALREMVAALHDTLRPYDASYPPAREIIGAYFDYLAAEVRETEGTFLLAEEDGRPVGFLGLFGLMAPFTPDEDSAPYTFISDLYVAPACRGRGVGRALLAQAEARARALGAPRLELAAHAANPAMALYTRQGFQPRLVIMSKRL